MAGDPKYMRGALSLALRNLGRTAPNPVVGSTIVKDDVVVGRGVTQPGGRPHSEEQSLAMAGERARGADMYVTLETCAHKSERSVNGSCAEQVRNAGIRRVFVSIVDPDPRTAGKGIALLRAAGIEVEVGLCAEEATRVNEGFITRVEKGRPRFRLKLATLDDGTMAIGNRVWMTGKETEAHVHLQRAREDAVMIGIGTLLADNPELTCRLPGFEDASPARIILDTHLRTPPNAKIFEKADRFPVCIVARENPDPAAAAALQEAGARILTVPQEEGGKLNLTALAQKLGEAGFTRVLCEGGPEVAHSLLSTGLVDRLDWIKASSSANRVKGGRVVMLPLNIEKLAERACLRPEKPRFLGDDTLVKFGPSR